MDKKIFPQGIIPYRKGAGFIKNMFHLNASVFPIGLDISDLSLKLVQLKKAGHKIQIQAIGRKKLPAGLIQNGQILNQEAVAKALNELLAKPDYGNVSSDSAVVCLPDEKTFIKLINIEKTPNNLPDIISSEIEKNVPIEIKNMYFDWQLIAEDAQTSQVLIGAAPKNIVNQYIDLISRTKLNVLAMEIETTAICRALLKEEFPRYNQEVRKNYFVIDIGAKRTSLTVYAQNTIVFSISLPISGAEITDIIAKNLEIDKEQAEKAKIICGLDKKRAKGIVSDILSDMINGLIAKIKDAAEFIENYYPAYSNIDEILLCGGGSNIKDLPEIIGQAVSIPTRTANSFINLNDAPPASVNEKYSLDPKLLKLTKNDKLNHHQDISLSYATAVGLALRNIFIA